LSLRVSIFVIINHDYEDSATNLLTVSSLLHLHNYCYLIIFVLGILCIKTQQVSFTAMSSFC